MEEMEMEVVEVQEPVMADVPAQVYCDAPVEDDSFTTGEVVGLTLGGAAILGAFAYGVKKLWDKFVAPWMRARKEEAAYLKECKEKYRKGKQKPVVDAAPAEEPKTEPASAPVEKPAD